MWRTVSATVHPVVSTYSPPGVPRRRPRTPPGSTPRTRACVWPRRGPRASQRRASVRPRSRGECAPAPEALQIGPEPDVLTTAVIPAAAYVSAACAARVVSRSSWVRPTADSGGSIDAGRSRRSAGRCRPARARLAGTIGPARRRRSTSRGHRPLTTRTAAGSEGAAASWNRTSRPPSRRRDSAGQIDSRLRDPGGDTRSALELPAPGRPQEHLDRIALRSVGEQPGQHRGAERLGGTQSMPRPA